MTDTYELAGQIRKGLYAIIDHYDEALEPVRRAVGSHVQSSKQPPLPVSAHVLDVRAKCCNDLAGWAQIILEKQDLRTCMQAGDVITVARFLITHADFLAVEAGTEALEEIEYSARELKRIAAPVRRDWQFLGFCPLEVDTEDGPTLCGGMVKAYPECDPYCAKCGTDGVVSWWEKVMFADPELTRLMTAPELVMFIHAQFGRVVAETTIRQWVARDVIAPAGKDLKGRTLFDRGAVAYALTRRQVFA